MANRLLESLRGGQFVLAPGLHDMMAAAIARSVGFDFVYASGYWLTASAFGLPDAGIATYTQMLDRVSTLVQCSDAAVIADADTGYGGLLNVHHTVRGYEQAGVTAIQIEDQVFPKKCGHTPNRSCISAAEMVEKIQVAKAALRRPGDTAIIARTDARQSEGFARCLERARQYADAGADILFVEALESEHEMREACANAPKPMLANMADGGNTPIRSAEALREIGYAMAIFPATTGLAAAQAIELALRTLKSSGSSASNELDLFNFKRFCDLIGFKEVWEFERRWGDAG